MNDSTRFSHEAEVAVDVETGEPIEEDEGPVDLNGDGVI